MALVTRPTDAVIGVGGRLRLDRPLSAGHAEELIEWLDRRCSGWKLNSDDSAIEHGGGRGGEDPIGIMASQQQEAAASVRVRWSAS